MTDKTQVKELLIIFAKNMIKGQVKTRLAAGIGHDNALKLYRELLNHTLAISRPLRCSKIIYYSDFIPPESEWKTAGFSEEIQNGSELGSRMSNAFEKAFEAGYENVIIIGTDCIELTTTGLENAFAQLHERDVVIGPARDGGYYLLGMRKLHRDLFLNKAWSTETVFDETLNDVHRQNLSFAVVEELSDIDTPEDLKASRLFQPKLSSS